MLRNVVLNDWITALIVFCIALIAMAKLINAKQFNDFFAIFGNSNYLKIYLKEQRFVNYFDGILFLNLIVSLTIFSVISIDFFNGSSQTENLNLFYRLTVGFGAIILIKILIDRLIGSLFEIDELMNVYVFQKITFKNYSGLILVPINILLTYVFIPSKILIFLSICLLFVVNVIGFAITFRNNVKTIKKSLFYFILYLCALEIAPCVILIKVIVIN